MSLHQSLMEALVVLGPDADEVADRLATLGFKGRQAIHSDCPLARYLKETLRCSDVLVGAYFCSVGGVEFPLPDATVDFVKKFDEDDKYPLLVDEALAHAPECPNLPDTCTCNG